MATAVHEETAKYRIEWDDDIDAVVHTWKEFTSGQGFKEGANALLEFFRSKGASKMLVDTSGIQAHEEADKRWLQEEWMQWALDAGLEASATVRNDSAVSKMDMDDFTDKVADLPYDVLVTADVGEARDWLDER